MLQASKMMKNIWTEHWWNTALTRVGCSCSETAETIIQQQKTGNCVLLDFDETKYTTKPIR